MQSVIGEKFGKLTVVSRRINNGCEIFNCLCDCGKAFYIQGSVLTQGSTLFCKDVPNTSLPIAEKETTQKVRKQPKQTKQRVKKEVKQKIKKLHKQRNYTNITGNRYGKFLVIKRVRDINGAYLWECLCDCGNIKTHSISALNAGSVKSCGCLSKDIRPLKDLTNQRFGKLLALKPNLEKRGSNRHIMWECLCDCGNIKEVSGANLLSGGTKSCGCLRKGNGRKKSEYNLDITGKKIGQLTVIRKTDEKNSGGYFWECQCECGNLHKAIKSHLNSGRLKSCGCLRSSKRSKT